MAEHTPDAAQPPTSITEAQVQRMVQAGEALLQSLQTGEGRDASVERYKVALELSMSVAEIEYSASCAALAEGATFTELADISGITKRSMWERVNGRRATSRQLRARRDGPSSEMEL
jgi:nitrogen-specific signal transduction histidine kinase